ncbi:MAG: ABC transporter permease [Bacteroidales bacterium]|nr:ABC transporter permease [Bacteroidales bacterium]
MSINSRLRRNLRENGKAWLDMFYILRKELYGIFTDKGTLIIFFVATLVYPLVCGYVYNKEMMRDAPIAVVDNNHSSLSRQYIRMLNATPEVSVAYHAMNMEEAKSLQKKGKIHGIVNIPKEFSSDINSGKQATVNIFADVTSFFWYRNLATASAYVSRTMGYGIEAKNLIARGSTYNEAMSSIRPYIPQEQTLFQIGGYPSFMLPIICIILLQQTILLGIGVLAGKHSERNRFRNITPNNIHYRGIFRIIFGRLLAVFIVYIPISIYVLIIVPHFFNIPQLYTSPIEVLTFIIPFLLASILLGMTCSVFFHHRENAIPFFIFMSIPILLMSGLSWPRESMPDFWRSFSYLFPSTFAANGFVRMGTMGANLMEISKEHLSLWILTAVYLVTTFFAYRWRLTTIWLQTGTQDKKSRKHQSRFNRLKLNEGRF